MLWEHSVFKGCEFPRVLAIYSEVYSLAKPLLMKLATAAGIQFHPEYTTVFRENANTYVGKAYGAVRLPDGTFKTHAETKRICLDDEEAKYRLEFMDCPSGCRHSGKRLKTTHCNG